MVPHTTPEEAWPNSGTRAGERDKERLNYIRTWMDSFIS